MVNSAFAKVFNERLLMSSVTQFRDPWSVFGGRDEYLIIPVGIAVYPCYYIPMKIPSLQEYITQLKYIVGSNKELEELANSIAELEYSIDLSNVHKSDLYYNYVVLLGFTSEFAFDWNEEAYDNEDVFLNDGIATIKQMLTDIDNNNLYHPAFRVKTVYTDKNGDGENKLQDIDAKNIEEAKKITDGIRASAPKAFADKPNITLLDVILNMEIVDSNRESRYKYNIEPEYGAYFDPQ